MSNPSGDDPTVTPINDHRLSTDSNTPRLMADGMCSQEMWRDLGQWVAGKMNVLIVGEAGSGKTHLLEELSGLFPSGLRIVTIENVPELKMSPNEPFELLAMTGNDGHSISDHVEESLRMNPDVIVVGEIYDDAAYDLVDAANADHQVFSTLHANGADDAIVRLMNLISMSGEISGDNALPMIASAFDIIVYVERLTDGSHKVMSISEVASRAAKDPTTGESSVATFPIWEFQQTGESADGRIIGEFCKVNDSRR